MVQARETGVRKLTNLQRETLAVLAKGPRTVPFIVGVNLTGGEQALVKSGLMELVERPSYSYEVRITDAGRQELKEQTA